MMMGRTMTPHPLNVGGVASSTEVFEIAADFIGPLVVTLALEGKKVIGTKWVFSLITNTKGKYKARLVRTLVSGS